jgi:hypothetical protein
MPLNPKLEFGKPFHGCAHEHYERRVEQRIAQAEQSQAQMPVKRCPFESPQGFLSARVWLKQWKRQGGAIVPVIMMEGILRTQKALNC